ncbi:MAG: cadmium-translocating P-type ATPase [Gammaproteobacteria bacterium]|nr:cadmium-translocating P-type ATPase [Gammaproteobacteria bacterium]
MLDARSHCFHCGKPIEATDGLFVAIDGTERHVCSDSCRRVVDLIAERDLGQFYRFREGPTGTASPKDQAQDRWVGYDREALQREFVTQQKDGARSAHLLLQGVRCAACAWLIDSAMMAVPGVRSVNVDPVTTRAELTWDPSVARLSELLAQLARLGYTPCPYTEDDADRVAVEERRASLKRLIVAGLGMMQVGSFAVAMYAGAFQSMDADIREFLRLISLMVATPVVFYAGWPFFVRAWKSVRERALGMDVPVSLAIGFAYAASVWNTFIGSGEVYFDSATMFVFFLSGARYLEMMGRHRALSMTGSMARHLPGTATRIVDGQAEEVGVMELQPGDRLMVQPGKALPADGLLISAEARLDESVLTGESTPIRKFAGDPVVAGSLNLTQAAELAVQRVGAETVMAQIGRLVTDAREQRPKLVELADRVASWFVTGVLLAATITGLVWWQIAPERTFEIVLAVLVVTCPCALALATPAVFTVATTALARRGFMIRRAGAVQALSQVTDVVFDKTGTLTVHDSVAPQVTPLGALDAGEAMEIAAALEACSEHPLARAFPAPKVAGEARDVRAVPGAGLEGRIGERRYRIGTRAFALGLTGAAAEDADGAEERRVVYLAGEQGMLAEFDIAERVRGGARDDMRRLAGLGLELTIASGDSALPVRNLAARLGVGASHARLKPEDKLRFVRELQEQGRNVAMVGDGINDSPVLAGADVSVAMGSGTSLAQYSADCVLMSPTLEPLTEAFSLSRKAMMVVRQNLVWAICYNLVALPLAAAGVLAPWMAALGMSGSSLLVTMNALRLGRRRPVPAPAPVAEKPACCKSMQESAS